jgi:hypothetical protein
MHLSRLRRSEPTNHPFGSAEFVAGIEKRRDHTLASGNPCGQPRRPVR